MRIWPVSPPWRRIFGNRKRLVIGLRMVSGTPNSSITMVRKKRVANKIFRIWENGVCLTSQDLIQQSGALFFQDLLTGEPSAIDCPDFSDFLSVISAVDNDGIAAIPSLEEGSPMPQGFTATTITLIPKVEGARAWSDFRPISLCNVTNKIISKLLYSRLRDVVERLVSPNQSGFVPGRMISDNILLAQELTHSITLPTRGGNVILKLDMAKAYDRVQGLRQGDPLSPLLFILGAEYLSRGLDRLYLQHPALRYRSDCDFLISHLAYADDVIIFASGGSRGMQRLVDFLHHYENCSGQRVNAAKSSLILPPRCSGRLRSRLLRITGFAEGHLPLKYLGVPHYRGNRTCSLFEPLLQSVRRKLEGWEIRTLSPGSRMTLIRSVLLSMPIYLFQVVQPPLAVMEKLERVFNAFLWGSRPLERNWHWARWSRACLPVLEGGLGFRRLKDLVECFSIKLWFRFRQGSSLWARFLFRKYCRLDAPACVPARGSISPIWRRLLRIRPRAEPGIRWRVGLGDVSFWDDTWFGDVPLSSRYVVHGGRDVRVSHFLSEGSWDFDRLCAVVAPSVAEAIVLIPVLSGDPDLARWIHSSDGAFSVRSAWELIRQRAPSSDIFRQCWGSWLRPTMSFFLWRFWHQWLPVDEVLQRRGFALASRCQCCDMSETFTHIFIRSPVARSVWHFFGAVFRVHIPDTEDFSLFLNYIGRRLFAGCDRRPGASSLMWMGARVVYLGTPAAGGVVRDDSGRVVLSFSEFIGAGSSLRAELWAVLLVRGFLFSPVLPDWCEWAQTLAHYMFGLLGIRWALALSLLVLFFGPLIFPGALFLFVLLLGPFLDPGGRYCRLLLARRLRSFTADCYGWLW
ncbi:uncharacterized protein [Primulina eburnea]|uniref:uncharacterized protein n=1 Tax=Primulina eburnea TaxID=1245227 RepID=UPI003C6CAADB